MKCLRYTSKRERIYDLTYGFANKKLRAKNNDYAKHCKKVKMKDRRSFSFLIQKFNIYVLQTH